MEDASISLENLDRERAGVILGSGIGGIQTFEDHIRFF
jgi:3-oxoacyl-[acyl-carrier-protein] synthase II